MLLGTTSQGLRYLVLVRLTFIGHFYNLLVPGRFGGEVVKSVRLAQLGIAPSAAAMSVVADRVTGLLALLTLGAIGILLAPPSGPGVPDLGIWLVAGVVLLLGLTLVLLTGRGNSILRAFGDRLPGSLTRIHTPCPLGRYVRFVAATWPSRRVSDVFGMYECSDRLCARCAFGFQRVTMDRGRCLVAASLTNHDCWPRRA